MIVLTLVWVNLIGSIVGIDTPENCESVLTDEIVGPLVALSLQNASILKPRPGQNPADDFISKCRVHTQNSIYVLHAVNSSGIFQLWAYEYTYSKNIFKNFLTEIPPYLYEMKQTLFYWTSRIDIIRHPGTSIHHIRYWNNTSKFEHSRVSTGIGDSVGYESLGLTNKIILEPSAEYHKAHELVENELAGSSKLVKEYDFPNMVRQKYERDVPIDKSGSNPKKAPDYFIRSSKPELAVGIWLDGTYVIDPRLNVGEDILEYALNSPADADGRLPIKIMLLTNCTTGPTLFIGSRYGWLYVTFLLAFLVFILIAFVCVHLEENASGIFRRPRLVMIQQDEQS